VRQRIGGSFVETSNVRPSMVLVTRDKELAIRAGGNMVVPSAIRPNWQRV